MRFSRRALAQAALVSISIAGVAACQPGAVPPSVGSIISPPDAGESDPSPTTGPTTDVVVARALGALAALDAGDRGALRDDLAPLAIEVATRAGVDAAALDLAWTNTESHRLRAVLSALSQVGVGYRYASSSPGGAFDCSGLVSWAWAQAGVVLPHQSKSIRNEMAEKDAAAVLPGDVFWYPGHVALALGVEGAMVHAPGRGEQVEVDVYASERIGGRIILGSPV